MLEHVLVVKNSVREFIHKGSASKEPFDATLKHRHLEKLMDVGPFSWISFKHHLEDVSYGGGEMRGKWRVLALDDFLGKLVERARIKGRCQGRHLVKEHSERPDVRLETVALTLNDLWGEIVGSSYHSLCFGARIWEYASNTKITQLYYVISSAENVLTLEVTMQNFLVMAVLHGEANLREPIQELILCKVILPAISINCLVALLDFAL